MPILIAMPSWISTSCLRSQWVQTNCWVLMWDGVTLTIRKSYER